MAIAGTLEIQMLANMARLTADMNTAKNTVGGAMKNIEGAVSSAKSMLASLGVGLGVGYFVSLVKGSIDAADHLQDLSKTTSITVERLAGLRVAAKQSGGDLDSIAQSINKLSQNMGKDAEKFKALGVSAKDPLEAFKQLSDIFVAIQDPQQRAAVMAAALGKSWAGAAPLLAEGGRRIGEIVEQGSALSGATSEMSKQADEFNDKLVLLTGTGGLLTRAIGPLLPLLNVMADDMLDAQKNATKLDGQFKPLLETFKALVVLGGNVAFVFKGVGTEVGGMAAQLAAAGRGDFAGVAAIRKAMIEDAEKARTEFDAWEKKILDVGSAANGVKQPLAGMTDEQKKAAAAAAAAAAEFVKESKSVNTLAKEIEKLLALGKKGEGEAAEARVKIWEDEQKAINDFRNAGFEEDKKLLALGVSGEEAAAVARSEAVIAEIGAINDVRNGAFDEETARIKKLENERLTAQVSMWQSVESAGHQAFLSIFDTSKSVLERIRAMLKTHLIDILYQMTAKKWIFNIVANVSGASVAQAVFPGMANAASTAGGVGNMFSGVSSLSSMFGGGGMYSAFATSAAGEFLGLSTSTALLGDATATSALAMTELGTSIGAFVPYVGWALAAFAAYKAFFGDHGTPTSSLGDMGRTYGPGGTVLSQYEGPFATGAGGGQLDALYAKFSDIATALGVTAGAVSFYYGANTGAGGTNPQFRLQGGAGGRSYDSGIETPLTDANVALAISRAIATAVQGSDLPVYLQKVFEGLDFSTMTQPAIDATLGFAGSLKQLRDQLTETRTPAEIAVAQVAELNNALGANATTIE